MNDDATEDSWKRISNNAGDNSTIFKKFMHNQIFQEDYSDLLPALKMTKGKSQN